MQERQVSFFSDGYRLDGTLYLPDDFKPGEKRPAIIPNSGYRGFNVFYPKLFARLFTAAGYVCLGFDYRGFANSEGIKGRVILDEQVEDIQNAITYLQSFEEVDSERIGILGWGMGASNVVRVAAMDKRVKAVAGLNGFYNGKRWLSAIHSYVRWKQLLDEVEEDRIQRVKTGKSRVVDGFHHYPLDPSTNNHVNVELVNLGNFKDPVTLEFTESILSLDADKIASDIAVPVFIAHGKDNLLHPIEESLAFYEALNQPKEFYLVNGQHNDFMYFDHPEFQRLGAQLKQFFAKALV